MRDEWVVVTSGVAEDEPTSGFFLRGAGWVIDVEWFKDTSFRYPEN